MLWDPTPAWTSNIWLFFVSGEKKDSEPSTSLGELAAADTSLQKKWRPGYSVEKFPETYSKRGKFRKA